MNTWTIALFIIFMCITGFIVKFVKVFKINTRHEFVLEYYNKVVELTDKKMSGRFDAQLYNWLIHNCDKMQYELGALGLISFVDRLTGIMAHDVPVLSNLLPEFQSEFDMYSSIARDRFCSSVQNCTNILMRYDGILDFQKQKIKKEIFNPLSLFAEGFRWLIHLPIDCLCGLGIVSDNTAWKVKRNILIVTFEKIATFVSFISSIMAIIMGWDSFTKEVVSLLDKIKEIKL